MTAPKNRRPAAMSDPLDEAAASAYREIQLRNQAPYDGVLGEPPDWVPENFRGDFHQIRNRLLEVYSHDDLLQFIAEMRDMLTPGTPSYSRPVTPATIMPKISTLAQLQEAVNLGRKKGLALLTDPEHSKRVTMGEDYSRRQAIIASKPRGRVSEDGETIGAIIQGLALSVAHEEENARELWQHFFSELDIRHLDPKEIKNPSDCWR